MSMLEFCYYYWHKENKDLRQRVAEVEEKCNYLQIIML